jgi:hypothetical protein
VDEEGSRGRASLIYGWGGEGGAFTASWLRGVRFGDIRVWYGRVKEHGDLSSRHS